MFRSSSALLVALAFAAGVSAQTVQPSSFHREHTHQVAQTITGPAKLTALLGAQRSAISVAVAQVHVGGAPDLVTGYATSTGGALVLQRGTMEAFAPSSEASVARIAAGEDLAPFEEDATALALPVRPDFLLAADPFGQGHADLLAAERGGSSVYFIAGSAAGTLTAPVQLALRGTLTALSTWRDHDGQVLIVAAVKGPQGSGLQLLEQDGTERGYVAVPASVTAMDGSQLNHGTLNDLVLVAGGKALVLDGDSILTAEPHFDRLPGGRAIAVAAGNYVWDRRGMGQVAILTADAMVHIVARTGLDHSDVTPAERAAQHRGVGPHARPADSRMRLTGKPWTTVETLQGIGSGGDDHAILLRSHFTVAGGDDLAVLTRGQYFEIAHITSPAGGPRTSTASITVDSTPGPVLSAVAARLSPDTRMGVVSAASGNHPLVAAPGSYYKRYYVNSYTDTLNTGSGRCVSNLALNATPLCNLRDALVLANADALDSSTSPDQIYLPSAAGTYTLNTRNTSATTDAQGDVNYHLNIQTNVNIIGQAGCTLNSLGIATACNTILNANGPSTQDIAFAIDSAPFDSNSTLHPYAVYMSGFQIQNGLNTNNPNGAASGFAAANGGGLIYTDLDGGILTLNTMVLTNGVSRYAYANAGSGAVAVFNSGINTNTLGNLEVDYTTMSNNQSQSTYGDGGAMLIAGGTNTVMNYGIYTGNTVVEYGGALYSDYAGGGLTPTANLTGLTISGNTAEQGGGLEFTNTVSMTNMTITGNTASAVNAGNTANTVTEGGAGLQFINGAAGTTNITSSTITGNKLTASGAVGAGIALDVSETSNPVNVNYNRIYGNTGGVTGSTGLSLGAPGSSTGGSAVSAVNNWWGCNKDPQTTNAGSCSVATRYGEGTLTTSPFTTLTLTLSSTTPTVGSTFTATGSLGQSSAPVKYSTAQNYAYLQTPVTISISNPSSGTTSGSTFSSTANTAVSYATVTDSATPTNPGSALASVTVDGCTIKDQGSAPTCNSSTTVNYTVMAPDLIVSSVHSGNFKAGDTADTYLLTVSNVGTASTSGAQVTLTDTLPSGFTAVSISGSGWTCTQPAGPCTRSDVLASSVNYPSVTLTASIASTDAGTYTNSASVSGGGETNTSNNTGTDPTVVVGPPTIAQSFSPANTAPGSTSTLTFTLGNPSANSVSLTSVGFTDTATSGLSFATQTSSNSCGGTYTRNSTTSFTFSGGSIQAGGTCSIAIVVMGTASGTSTSSAVTASNSNAGGTSSASLSVGYSTTTMVSVGSNALTVGGTTQISAAVSDTAGVTPQGTVTFFDTVGGSNSTLGTANLSGSGGSATAMLSYNAATAGNHTITATYNPASSTFATSSDTTGKTITISPAPAGTGNVYDSTQVGKPISVPQGGSIALTVLYDFPGTVPPGGAITISVNGSSAGFSTLSCVNKSKHTNCSTTYTANLISPGSYTVSFTVAADANYGTISGSAPLTVTSQ